MPVKFFGQYLMEKGAVTRAGLLKAVELQDSVNLKFGDMARSMGLISDADIERVHDAQRSKDQQFGDMCLSLGILTSEQVQQVLARQKRTHLYIGEALVRINAIQETDLARHLEAFKADQAPYAIEAVVIPRGVPHADLWEITADLTYKMFSRVVNITFRRGACTTITSMDRNDVVVAMPMHGAVEARYMLSVSAGVRDQIARSILKAPDVSTEPREVLVDAVMELMNTVCGNVAAKAAQHGHTIEIAPPEIVTGPLTVPVGGTGILFPLHIAEARVEAAVFIEKA